MKLDNSEGINNTYETLSEFLAKNVYFMYWWPAYYGQEALKYALTNTIDQQIQNLEDSMIANEKFISFYDYGLIVKKFCENDETIKMACNNFNHFDDKFKLSKKYASSQAARVLNIYITINYKQKKFFKYF